MQRKDILVLTCIEHCSVPSSGRIAAAMYLVFHPSVSNRFLYRWMTWPKDERFDFLSLGVLDRLVTSHYWKVRGKNAGKGKSLIISTFRLESKFLMNISFFYL